MGQVEETGSVDESEARHRLLVESWAQAVWVADAAGVVTTDSPSWRAYTGQTLEEWLGYGWLGAIHPDDRAYAEQKWRQAVAARGLFDAEYRLRAPDGGWRWTNVRAAPVFDAAGEIQKWLGMNIDIDKRKRSEAEVARLYAEMEQRVAEATAELKDSRDLLRAVFDASEDMIQIFEAIRDEDGEVIDFRWLLNNHASEKRYGDVRGESLLTRNPGVIQEGIFDAFKRVTKTGVPERAERHYVHEQFDGWFYQSVVKLNDGVATTTKDISEWKLAEARQREQDEEAAAQLRESEERLRRFGEASHDVLWIRDAENLQWTYLTPAFETIYGLDRNEALTGDNYRSWLELVVEEDREHARENIRRVRAGEHVTFEYRIRRPVDGVVRWIRNTDFPITDAAGEPTLIGGIGHDITEMKLHQKRLEASEERLRNAAQVAKLGLWDWNVRTGAIYWSDEHFRMEGYRVGEVVPSYETWAARIHPDDRAGTEAALQRAMDLHEEFAHEFRVVHPDDSVHWLSGRGSFFYDEGGRPTRMVGAMVDTTERREWEERQQVLIAELQHRTRNLMGVVRSVADKTARTSVDLPDFRARFRDRLEALSRVQGLLSRLNDHDRVAFNELIETELAAMGCGTDQIRLEGPKGVRLRSSTVQTLAMALHELATNAVKYGALGQVGAQLAVTWHLQADESKGEPWLHIDWRESGVEMPLLGAAKTGSGHGRELIERALPYQLSAKTSYKLGPDGVHCTVLVPISTKASQGDPHG